MVASDDDRGRECADLDHIVEHEPGLISLAKPEPTDAAGEPLECELGLAISEVPCEECFWVFMAAEDPLVEAFVVSAVFLGEELEEGVVGFVDVCRITRKSAPAEWATPEAELGADVRGDEAGECECILESLVKCSLTDVVAVVESDRAE